jgi:hypothetical protein
MEAPFGGRNSEHFPEKESLLISVKDLQNRWKEP